MREEWELIEKSERFLNDAKVSFNEDLSLETVQNRIYYSMFLAAKAALITEGIDAGTHQKVNRKVGKVFVKDEERIDRETGSFYSRMQTLREQADYDPETSLDEEDVKGNLEKAENFLQQMKNIIQSKS